MNAVNKFEKEKKNKWKGGIRSKKGFTLFILNEDVNDVTKITKALEDLGLLIYGFAETVKHKMKKQEGRFLRALLAPLGVLILHQVIYSVVKSTSTRGVRRAGR